MLKAIPLIAHWIALAHDRFRSSTAGRMLFSGGVGHLHEQISMHREHAELLRCRMEHIPPAHRPHWRPHERLRILIFGERYACSQKKLARMFGITAATLSRWKRDLENGADRLVRTKEPANKLSDLVAEVVHLIKRDFPAWGTPRIAGQLLQMTVKCSRSSVRRILSKPRPRKRPSRSCRSIPEIKATRPNQVFVIDFTTFKALFRKVEIGAVIDSFTRKVKAIRAFSRRPTTDDALALIRDAIQYDGKTPQIVISDKGQQLRKRFRRALKRRWKIRLKHTCIGEVNLSRIDRFWRSLKAEYLNGLFLWWPSRILTRRLRRYAVWFNAFRSHQGIHLRTPEELNLQRTSTPTANVRSGRFIRENLEGDRSLPIYRFTHAA